MADKLQSERSHQGKRSIRTVGNFIVGTPKLCTVHVLRVMRVIRESSHALSAQVPLPGM